MSSSSQPNRTVGLSWIRIRNGDREGHRRRHQNPSDSSCCCCCLPFTFSFPFSREPKLDSTSPSQLNSIDSSASSSSSQSQSTSPSSSSTESTSFDLSASASSSSNSSPVAAPTTSTSTSKSTSTITSTVTSASTSTITSTSTQSSKSNCTEVTVSVSSVLSSMEIRSNSSLSTTKGKSKSKAKASSSVAPQDSESESNRDLHRHRGLLSFHSSASDRFPSSTSSSSSSSSRSLRVVSDPRTQPQPQLQLQSPSPSPSHRPVCVSSVSSILSSRAVSIRVHPYVSSFGWRCLLDPPTGRPFYFHTITAETTWIPPPRPFFFQFQPEVDQQLYGDDRDIPLSKQVATKLHIQIICVKPETTDSSSRDWEREREREKERDGLEQPEEEQKIQGTENRIRGQQDRERPRVEDRKLDEDRKQDRNPSSNSKPILTPPSRSREWFDNVYGNRISCSPPRLIPLRLFDHFLSGELELYQHPIAQMILQSDSKPPHQHEKYHSSKSDSSSSVDHDNSDRSHSHSHSNLSSTDPISYECGSGCPPSCSAECSRSVFRVLRRLILCSDLHYLGQKRSAIPVARSGTLYLDVETKEAYFMQDVFHHELFHLIDLHIAKNTTQNNKQQKHKTNKKNNDNSDEKEKEGQEPKEEQKEIEKNNEACTDPHHYPPPHDHSMAVGIETKAKVEAVVNAVRSPVLAWSSSSSLQSAPSPAVTSPSYPFFHSSSSSSPLSSSSSSSPSRPSHTNINQFPDPIWCSLNPPDFVYGSGGAQSRQHIMFLSAQSQPASQQPDSSSSSSSSSPSSSVFPHAGFLNFYSETALEEDKAEIYAALIRHSSAVLCHPSDVRIRNKACEMKRRLNEFCLGQLDRSGWWETKVQNHRVYPKLQDELKEMNSAIATQIEMLQAKANEKINATAKIKAKSKPKAKLDFQTQLNSSISNSQPSLMKVEVRSPSSTRASDDFNSTPDQLKRNHISMNLNGEPNDEKQTASDGIGIGLSLSLAPQMHSLCPYNSDSKPTNPSALLTTDLVRSRSRPNSDCRTELLVAPIEVLSPLDSNRESASAVSLTSASDCRDNGGRGRESGERVRDKGRDGSNDTDLESGWLCKTDPFGHVYYYNSRTRQTSWLPPIYFQAQAKSEHREISIAVKEIDRCE